MYIDEKFKDCSPQETVSRIQGILADLGIEVCEKWNDSGIENCNSLTVQTHKGLPGTNGKGISKEFARASAYAEYIERLQSGLFLVSYQSVIRDPEMNFHAYAPDGKYITFEELIETGDWMDHIVNSYNNPRITRKTIAQNCKAYACADDGKILTVPFYSLFENKYVYLPVAFVEQMYRANGNCAGNTREEAWVHALSEIMERNASRKMVMSGKAYPAISEETLQKFPTVSKILKRLRENGDFDVKVFDCSLGNGFPVVATRVINKKDQTYLVNMAADPVLEIAIQRTMTELFQGRAIDEMRVIHKNRILNKVTDFSVVSNVLNHTQTSDGLYTADFFSEELTCERKATDFVDNSNKSNKELLQYMLGLYKDLNLPVYVRNYSFLGFPSYKFVVPGFSESRAVCLDEIIPEAVMADAVRETFKNATKATNDELALMLSYSNKIKSVHRQYKLFGGNAGVPLNRNNGFLLTSITRAYAQYKLGNYASAISELALCLKAVSEEDATYFRCINMYLQLKLDGIDDEKIRIILYRFFKSKYPDSLYEKIKNGLSPYDDYLFKCDLNNCDNCRYKESCCYDDLKNITAKLGEKYKAFSKGQDPEEFAI